MAPVPLWLANVRKTLSKNLKTVKQFTVLSLATLFAIGGLAVAPQTAKFVAPQAKAQALPGSADIQLPPLPPQSSELRLPNGQKLGDIYPGATPRNQGGKPAPQNRTNNAKPAPRIGNGQSRWVYTNSSGRSRRYLVVMPTHYNPSRPAPMLFGFHGWSDPVSNFQRYSRLHQTGAAVEAIRIYPEAVNLSWEGAPYANVRPGEDVKFMTQIIDEIDNTYNVDRRRIYATGHSNGGGMTAVVACHLPHVFAGVASVGGAFYAPVNMGCSNQPISILVSHGVGDTMMKYNGGTRHGARYIGVPELMNSYKRRNGCAPNARVTNIPGGRRHVYACSRAETQLLTNPQNHTWNMYYDATQEVWNFLKRQRL